MQIEFNKTPQMGELPSASDQRRLYHESYNRANITAAPPVNLHTGDGGDHIWLDLQALGQALANYDLFANNFFVNLIYAQTIYANSIVSTLFTGIKFARVTVTSLGAGYARSGNVITASANGTLGAQDGITLVVTDRVLLRSGNSDAGLYEVTSVGSAGTPFVLTRTSDADDSTEMVSGTLVYVRHGTDGSGYKDTAWRLVTEPPIVLNTTSLDFRLAFPQGVRLLAQEIYGRSSIRLVNGTNITWGIVDDDANDEVEITPTWTGFTLREQDGSPIATGIVTLSFDQDDGFQVSSVGSFGRVDMLPASTTQAGIVSIGAQTLGGAKTISSTSIEPLTVTRTGLSPTVSFATNLGDFGCLLTAFNGTEFSYLFMALDGTDFGDASTDPALFAYGVNGGGTHQGRFGVFDGTNYHFGKTGSLFGATVKGGVITGLPSVFGSGSIPIADGSGGLAEDSGLQFNTTNNALTLGGGGYLISTATSAPSGIPTNSIAGPFLTD